MKDVAKLMCLIAVLAGCSEDAGGGESCEQGACGGNIAGKWEVETTCVVGDLAALASPMGEQPAECADMVASADLGTVQLTAEYGADLSFAVAGTIGIEMQFHVTEACFRAQSMTMVELATEHCTLFQTSLAANLQGEISCSFKAEACDCSVKTDVAINSTGTYTLMGNQILHSDDSEAQDYCVKGDQLFMRAAEEGSMPANFVAKRVK